MKYKIFTQLYLSIALIGLFIFILFNYIVDPYNLNGQVKIYNFNNNKYNVEAQSRIFKIRLFDEQKDVQGIYLGGSRATFLGNTEYIETLTGKKYYNFATNEQEIYEMYHYLKYALSKSSLEEVILSLDVEQFGKERSVFNQEEPQKMLMNNDDILYYLSYRTFMDSLKTVLKNYKNYPIIYNTQGWKIVNHLDYYGIKKEDEKEFLKSKVDIKEESLKNRVKKFHLDPEKLEYFEKIVRLCNNNDVNLRIFFNPIYKKHYKYFYGENSEEIETFKNMIATKVSFYDFTGNNVINSNYMNFLDSVSHPQQYLSNYILDFIFLNKKYKDFGIYITKKNSDRSFVESTEKLDKGIL